MKNREKKKTRYAFIDVQNTETTANKMLGFVIDWKKLYQYLVKKWGCQKVFFYSGIQQGNEELVTEYKKLEGFGYIVKIKPYFIYKNKDSSVKINCPNCRMEINHKLDGGVKWKSNCDVELSVDAKNQAKAGAEFLIFTGDGDFEYLMRDLIPRGVKIYVISSAKKIYLGPRYFISRFSTKLRKLIADKPKEIFFLDLNDWKMRIKKDT